MTLRVMYNKLKAAQKTLIDTTTHTEDYLAGYTGVIDWVYLVKKFGSLSCAAEDLTELAMLVETAFTLFDYKWSKLYETTQLEYNPIWNYDGENTITTTYGAKEETTTYGEDKSSVDNSMAPFESSTTRPTDSTESTREQHIDKFETIEHIDEVHEVKGGNQGTTTTQSMIEEERRVSDFAILDVILNDIVNIISNPYFEEE